ncbi:MAG: methylated-DNA--[protein]-cysteine S-methyltransferase [Tannerella sp.]|jgi:methylated-DNA-[protein]-cysteine S-methyltransferase|nr:methylated-DNA--[protein]-cysteine S-methyltransferase [Tannerella sp.]
MNSLHYHSPVGTLCIAEDGNAIVYVTWAGTRQAPAETAEEATPLLREAVRQLSEYFAGRRRTFDLPLAPQGTAFQLRTWQALREIPYGQTRSYGQIAEAVGCPKGARAVGMANNRNPISILMPCHRVIGADGRLVGYAGGLDVKKQLLELERLSANGCMEADRDRPSGNA